MITIEMWACVDDSGDYAVGVDEETATEKYTEDFGDPIKVRLVKCTVTLPAPKIIELKGVVQDVNETGTLTAVGK